MNFEAIPAIDVRDGRVVRLAQGDYQRETVYGTSPLAVAQAYEAAGARWLHLVDLDAARLGGFTLGPLVQQLRDQTQLNVQAGGGIRCEADVQALLDAGVARVVVGTLAVMEPTRVRGWLGAYGVERITLALDARQDAAGVWRLPVAGWTEHSPHTLQDLLQGYVDAGLIHLLCTDISRDGMLSGFNLELYRSIAERWPAVRLQASGGVRSVADVSAARSAGASAAILGRALLEGDIDLKQALAC